MLHGLEKLLSVLSSYIFIPVFISEIYRLVIKNSHVSISVLAITFKSLNSFTALQTNTASFMSIDNQIYIYVTLIMVNSDLVYGVVCTQYNYNTAVQA